MNQPIRPVSNQNRDASLDQDLPLCVDLDHTLVRTNTLLEATAAVARINPWTLVRLPIWLGHGQAFLWSRIAEIVNIKMELLPYRQDVVVWLKSEHSRGRSVVMVTGAHQTVAAGIAAYLGCFSEAVGSNETTHLVGPNKLSFLRSRFGDYGYDYVGSNRDDLVPASKARKFLLAGATRPVEKLPEPTVCEIFPCSPEAKRGAGLVRLLRPHQWSKNLLVLAPIVLSHRWSDTTAATATALIFICFCLVSSAGYILNDFLDMDADRAHPTKRTRPLAAGTVSIVDAAALTMVLLVIASSLLWYLGSLAATSLITAYAIATAAYSSWIKRLVIFDVIVLMALYCLRILAGGAATSITVSPWTLGFSMFIFFSLAMMKRYTELLITQNPPNSHNRRGYVPVDSIPILCLGIGSGLVSILVVALYLTSPEVVNLYQTPMYLALVCPALLLWISRLWLLAGRNELHDDPVLFAVRDPQSWAIAAVCIASILLAL